MGTNTWGSKTAEKLSLFHSIIINRFFFLVIRFCCCCCVLKTLSFTFTARSPVFSAMFEHEMEESKKVSLFMNLYFYSLLSHILSHYTSKACPFSPSQSDRPSHLYSRAQLVVFMQVFS